MLIMYKEKKYRPIAEYKNIKIYISIYFNKKEKPILLSSNQTTQESFNRLKPKLQLWLGL